MKLTARIPTAGWVAMAAFLLLAALLAGCGGTSSETEAGKPHRGGTLTVAEESEPDTLDPAKGIIIPDVNIIEQVTEGLFRTNSEQEPKPWLIESYEKSKDLRTWTFHLKPDVRFSTGKKMTAADVVFSIDAARKSEIWQGLYEPITSVTATDPTTVSLKTSTPCPALPYMLAIYPAGIIPNNYEGKSEKAFGEDPIGTGPFKLISWKHSQSLTLGRNTFYWRSGLPYLDRVVYVNAPEDNSRVSQLKAGDVDVIAKPSYAQVGSLESTPGLGVTKAEHNSLLSVLLNANNPLLENAKVREAISLAVDRGGVVEAAAKGLAQPAAAWYLASLRYADAGIKPPAQNLAKAKRLLQEGVAETGEQPDLKLLYASGEELTGNAAQIVQQGLDEAGFKITLAPADVATVSAEYSAGNYDLSLAQTITLVPDPIEWFGYYLSTEGLFTRAPLGSVEGLIKEASEESSEVRREALYHEIQERLTKENYLVNLIETPVLYAHGEAVHGIELNFTGVVRLANVWLAE